MDGRGRRVRDPYGGGGSQQVIRPSCGRTARPTRLSRKCAESRTQATCRTRTGLVGDCYDNAMCESFFATPSASCSIASASAPRARRGSRSSTSSRASTILDGDTRHSAISRRSSSSVRRQPEPGFARVDPLRGRVSQGLQEKNQRESTMNARGRSQALRCPPKRGSSRYAK